jgi:ABC-type transport system involved in multi-copper enzyme maturation permease subunit
MTALVSTEALKLATLRLSWIVAALAVAVSATIGFASVRISIDAGEPLRLAALAGAPAQAMWFLAILVAVLASAGEFQHRTIRTTLLSAPRRARVLVAKSAIAAAYGALLVLLGTAGAVVAGMITTAGSGESMPVGGTSWAHLAGAVAVGAVFAVLATGLGVLTRSTAAAIGAVLLWRFVGEGILPPLLREDDLTRWTPNGAAGALVGLGAHPLAPWAAALMLGGYGATVCALAAVLFLRREPT